MLIEEKNEPQLKTWLTERLEKISDADSDVLADYVIALVKSDDSETTLRKNCVDNLEDFVKDQTNGFVDDVFTALKSKSYIPGYKPPPQRPQKPTFQQSPPPPRPNPRKRGYVDRDDPSAGDLNGYGRVPKAPRRGVGPTARGRGARRPQFAQLDSFQGSFQPPMDPRYAMAALQAMGFPVPQLPQDFQQMFNGSAGRRQRCHDYDTKGFCAAGANCPYEHGSDALVVANNDEGHNANTTSRPQRNGKLSKRQRKLTGTANQPQPNRRASFSSANPAHAFQNSTLVVEHIPPESYTDAVIRDYFGQFGEVKELTLRDPRRFIAVIEFADHEAAQQAYDSPKAIFDNRFVKVYWHKPRRTDQSNGSHKLDVTMHGPSVDPSDPGFLEKQAKAQAEFEERRRKADEAKQARLELEQRVKEHNEAKQKLLVQLAERTGEPPPESDEAADGETEGKTEALRAQLAALEQEAKNMGLNPEDAGAPAFRYSSTFRGRGGFPTYRGRATRGGGRGGFRGGATASAAGVARLDNRPRSISVTPVRPADDSGAIDFAANEKHGEALRTFLFSIGADVAEVRFEESSPPGHADEGGSANQSGAKDKAVIVFRERYQAEAFVDAVRSAGYDVPSLGRVELAWVANASVTAPAVVGAVGVDANSTVPDTAPVDAEEDAGEEDAEMEDGQVDEGEDGDGDKADEDHQQQAQQARTHARPARRYAAETEQDFDVAE